MAGFMSGFGQGMSQLPALMDRKAEREQEMEFKRLTMARQKILDDQKSVGDVISSLTAAVRTTPEDQLGNRFALTFADIEQRTGKPIPSSVKAAFKADPETAVKTMAELFVQKPFGFAELGETLSNPQAVAGLMDAMNQRRTALQMAAMASGSPQAPQAPSGLNLGVNPSVAPSTPSPAPSTPAPTTAYGALEAKVASIDQQLVNLRGLPGAEPQAQKALLDSLQQQQKVLVERMKQMQDSAHERAAARMGIRYENANPLQLQMIEADVQRQLGLTKQAEATGTALGGLVDKEVAAKSGINPLRTVAEARGDSPLGGKLGRTVGNGEVRLPSPAEEGDLAAQRTEAVKRMSEYREASTASEASDVRINQLQSLLATGAKTGITAPIEKRIKQILGDLTGQKFDDVAPATLIGMASDALSLAAQTAMKGNTSDSDRTWLKGQFPGLATDQNAVHIFGDMQILMNKRIRDREQLLGAYNKTCGMDGRKCNIDFPGFYEDWMKSHPLQPQFQEILEKRGYKQKPAVSAPATPVLPAQTSAVPRTQPAMIVPSAEGQGGAAFGVPPRGIPQKVR